MWSTVLHAGLAGSFLRVPHIPPDQRELRKAGAAAAIYGMPWDSTAVSRSGASYGPRGIREITSQFLSYNATWDFDLLASLALVDCGDCPVVVANAASTFDRSERDIVEILSADAVPVVLGGDHSVTIPAVRAIKRRVANPGLILIDTHLDTAVDVGGETLSNCCPISRAVDAGFDPRHIVLVAISGWMNPRPEVEYCRDRGISIIWLEDLWQHGAPAVIERVLEIAANDTEGFYLTVDIDALDGAYGPGTSTPTPGGLTSRELLSLVRGIARRGLLGMDVVEVAPSLEAASITAGMAVRVIMDGLAAHAGATVEETKGSALA
jgi:agmatinase/guanidinobutyrase